MKQYRVSWSILFTGHVRTTPSWCQTAFPFQGLSDSTFETVVPLEFLSFVQSNPNNGIPYQGNQFQRGFSICIIAHEINDRTSNRSQ